ncbi:MAG: serine protease [Candidatus Pacebacteria bacterium]|nr:serine protease [Candidatus Paceibacterota bacterium]
MDIERLTKAQIVLLTLLVSFVTSIATGIVTVTLLDQAPPVVTQTINRVVEHTVERVVPGEQTATVITKEKTVVVNEDDLITQSIEENTDKIVKVYRETELGSVYLGAGAIVSKDGVVAAAIDRSMLGGGTFFTVVFGNGKTAKGELVPPAQEKPTALIRLTFTEENGVIPGSIKYGDINSLKLGQRVLTLYGKGRLSVETGIIAGLDEEETEIAKTEEEEGAQDAEPTIVSVLTAIETSMSGAHIERGGVLLNLYGEVVGISTARSRLGGGARFTPIQVVQSQIIELAAAEAAAAEGAEGSQ